jgi:GNAT superfamily N-acetyltransferase
MPSLGDALLYLRDHQLRRTVRKLFRTYVYGHHRMYLTCTDLIELATRPFEEINGLEVCCVRPDRSLIASFPHLKPSAISKWAGPGHFFFLAALDGRPIAYRCMASTAGPSLARFFRLRPDQLFTIGIFTQPDLRRRGLTRPLKITAARHVVREGYREAWAVERTSNYDTVVAAERTGTVRVGTLIRTSWLGRARYVVIPVTVLSAVLLGRQLDLLRHLAPDVIRVGVLFNPSLTRLSSTTLESINALAADRGVELKFFEAREEGDQIAVLERAFASMAASSIQGLILHSDPMLRLHARSIVSLADRHHLAAVFDARPFVIAGGLVAYGATPPSLHDLDAVSVYFSEQQRATVEPHELCQAVELVLNHRVAAALGPTIPPALRPQTQRVAS